MNPPVNRSSESPLPPDNQLPDDSIPSSAAAESASSDSLQRQEPIPPPSHPRQYRAIGLIRGKYQRSEEQMTRGTLIAEEGTAIDAVLLGRVISLVKNHLDLEKSHLWVVYPRIRQEDDHLHVQIVGVWEPETLSPNLPETDTPATPQVQHGYFSIRGEVIYASQETGTVIIKIKQAPKRESDKTKFFKLKLQGTLSERSVGHFWDLQVQLAGDTLVIQDGMDLGFLPRKKPRFLPDKGAKKYPAKPQRRSPASESRPLPPRKPTGGSVPTPNKPILPKPTKKKPQDA